MCLGIPGRIVEVREDRSGVPVATVSFGDVSREVCLAYLPDAAVGDHVLVHVGFAIGRLEPEEAERTMALLAEMDRAQPR